MSNVTIKPLLLAGGFVGNGTALFRAWLFRTRLFRARLRTRRALGLRSLRFAFRRRRRAGAIAVRRAARRRLFSVVGHVPARSLEPHRRRRNQLLQLPTAVRTDRERRIGKLLDSLRQTMTFLALIFVERQCGVPTVFPSYDSIFREWLRSIASDLRPGNGGAPSSGDELESRAQRILVLVVGLRSRIYVSRLPAVHGDDPPFSTLTIARLRQSHRLGSGRYGWG